MYKFSRNRKSDSGKFIFSLSLLAIFLTICWAWDHTRGHTNPFAEKNRYERAHTVLYFKNGSQIEIFTFLQLSLKMLNYSILDHIYVQSSNDSTLWDECRIYFYWRVRRRYSCSKVTALPTCLVKTAAEQSSFVTVLAQDKQLLTNN